MDEAHVEHGVGLVQDQKFNPLQRQQALVAQVQQPSWRGHEHIGPFAELGDLTVLAYAPKNQGGANLDVLGVRLDVLVNLGGQFPCRGEHEHAWNRATVHHVVGQVVHQGQGERSGFAGACLGNAHHVTSVEDVWNGLFLDGGGLLVSERNQGFKHLGVQAHVRKLHEKRMMPRIHTLWPTHRVCQAFVLPRATSKGACRPR